MTTKKKEKKAEREKEYLCASSFNDERIHTHTYDIRTQRIFSLLRIIRWNFDDLFSGGLLLFFSIYHRHRRHHPSIQPAIQPTAVKQHQ